MDKEIVEGDKLIAEFDENEYVAHSDSWLFKDFRSYKSWRTNELQYHTSWDWLMPVVQKIDKDFPEPIQQKSEIYDALLCLDFERLWKAVIQFINWYNQNKQP